MKEQKIESIKYDSSKKTKDLHKEYQSILDKLEKGKEPMALGILDLCSLRPKAQVTRNYHQQS